jgi:quercetin dioxygenase-like cupin family protein
VQVLDGVVEITIGGTPYVLKSGESIIMPASIPHALKAIERFKMMLIMIKS